MEVGHWLRCAGSHGWHQATSFCVGSVHPDTRTAISKPLWRTPTYRPGQAASQRRAAAAPTKACVRFLHRELASKCQRGNRPKGEREAPTACPLHLRLCSVMWAVSEGASSMAAELLGRSHSLVRAKDVFLCPVRPQSACHSHPLSRPVQCTLQAAYCNQHTPEQPKYLSGRGWWARTPPFKRKDRCPGPYAWGATAQLPTTPSHGEAGETATSAHPSSHCDRQSYNPLEEKLRPAAVHECNWKQDR